MTRAKRYEGGALRAEQWHSLSRTKAYEALAIGMKTVNAALYGKFATGTGIEYDEASVKWVIVIRLYPWSPQRAVLNAPYYGSDTELVRFVEEATTFPSEHFLVKLALLTGGTVNA